MRNFSYLTGSRRSLASADNTRSSSPRQHRCDTKWKHSRIANRQQSHARRCIHCCSIALQFSLPCAPDKPCNKIDWNCSERHYARIDCRSYTSPWPWFPLPLDSKMRPNNRVRFADCLSCRWCRSVRSDWKTRRFPVEAGAAVARLNQEKLCKASFNNEREKKLPHPDQHSR